MDFNSKKFYNIIKTNERAILIMNMKFNGAVINERNLHFAIVLVKPTILSCSYIESLRADFSAVFNGLPVVLMAQAPNGTTRFSGRRDFVNFLYNVPLSSINWKKYTLEFKYRL